jgi:type I restriction enzyme S subunit
VKKGREICSIGEVCDLLTGGTPSKTKPEYFGGSIKWLVSGDIHQGEIFDCDGRITEAGLQNSNARYLPVDSVLIALAGQGKTRGTVALLRTKATCNQSLICIAPKDRQRLLPEFIYVNLHGRYEEIRRMTGDSGDDRRGLNMRLVGRIQIPIPPLPEQRRIVAILGEAFQEIAAAKANAEKCLRNAQELFESWLNAVVDGNRNRWRHVKFGQITNLKRGHNPPKSQFVYSPRKGYVRFWQIRDGASDDKAVYVPDSPKLHRVVKSDILLVAYRHVGRCFRGVEGAFNVALCCVSNANPEILSSDFLYHMIPTKIVRGELLKYSERSLIPSMSVKHLAEIPIPLPPLEEQLRISKQIEALKTAAGEADSIIQTKLSALDELKASLLHQAFSGAM